MQYDHKNGPLVDILLLDLSAFLAVLYQISEVRIRIYRD